MWETISEASLFALARSQQGKPFAQGLCGSRSKTVRAEPPVQAVPEDQTTPLFLVSSRPCNGLMLQTGRKGPGTLGDTSPFLPEILIFSENQQNPKGNSDRLLKRTMVEKNGNGINP